jgi:GNAT superfamily N-acetyltransferase
MIFRADKTTLDRIIPLRSLFLQQTNVQIRYNACHERGWSDSYLLWVDDQVAGYGSVKGMEQLVDRDTIFEFFLLPFSRIHATKLFSVLLESSGSVFIECQTNEPLLTSMIYEFAQNIHSDTILFDDQQVSELHLLGILFRERRQEDELFHHNSEPEGSHVLLKENRVLATGGFLLHYNKPFADLYMEVRPDARLQGFGSLLIQELKKACYQAGRVPAARCNLDNIASKSTLLKAGMGIAGYMLVGKMKG